MQYTTPNKYVLVTTEKENHEAGFIGFGWAMDSAKSKKHLDNHRKKRAKYTELIRKDNKNWVSIDIRSRGKYRFCVQGDCVDGFNKNMYIFSPTTVSRIKDYLVGKLYKTSCGFDEKGGNCIIYANFTNWEDASDFACYLAQLPLDCYVDYRTRYGATPV